MRRQRLLLSATQTLEEMFEYIKTEDELGDARFVVITCVMATWYSPCSFMVSARWTPNVALVLTGWYFLEESLAKYTLNGRRSPSMNVGDPAGRYPTVVTVVPIFPLNKHLGHTVFPRPAIQNCFYFKFVFWGIIHPCELM